MTEVKDLKDIVQGRAEVSALLQKTTSSRPQQVSQWISPHESHLSVFEHNYLDDPSAVTSLVGLHEAIFTHRKYKSIAVTDRKKIFLQFDESEVPESTPPRPTLSEVRRIVESGELFMAIYSSQGYNFSLEFSHVYGGESNIDTSFIDLVEIMKRAVRAIDPSVSLDLAQMYAEYILRIATWEVKIANATCMATLEANFPSIKAKVMEKVKFSVPSIYIERGDDMNMCFWVRVCPGIESTSDDVGELRDKDKLYEKHTSFCYYRRYPISRDICEELDLAGFADSSTGEENTDSGNKNEDKLGMTQGAVLPPPKKPEKNEIFVAMIVRNTSEMDEKTHAEMDEVAFTIESEFEEGISNSIMYESEAVSGVDTPRKSNRHNIQQNDKGRQKPRGEVWVSNSSPFAEIYGWGRNTAYLFDKTKEKISDSAASMLNPDKEGSTENNHDSNYICFNPTAIPIPPSIHLERIKMVACSPSHMLVLTYNGSVYGCGDNTEGALGLGDTNNRLSLDLVLWPIHDDEIDLDQENFGKERVDNQRHVVCIGAGAAAIGSHSMAITESGDLYGWGVAYAAGHGTAKKSITSPQKIFMPQPREILVSRREEAKRRKEAAILAGEIVDDEPELTEEDMTAAEIELRDSKEIEAAGSAAVRHVACGGGFTIAVLESGHVASWGMWSHGRLGQGPPPKIEGETIRVRGRQKKKVVRYLLRPRLIPALRNVVKVSCGEAHAICVTRRGRVYSWGQNSCGQVGNGPTPSGFLRDAMEPVLLSFNRDPSMSNRYASLPASQPSTIINMRITDVCAGTFHSLAKDSDEGIWSWGARGDVCLGHNDPPIAGTWATRVPTVFSPSSNSQKILVPFELMQWCSTWSKPRHIRSLVMADENESVSQMTAGDMHSAFLISSGRLYLCGTGPVVPPIFVNREKNEDDEDEDVEGSQQAKDIREDIDKAVDEMNERMTSVTTPRCPSSMWLYKVSIRVCKYLCSAGTYIVVVQDEDLISASLTQKLLNHTTDSPVNLTSDSVTQDVSGSVSSSSTGVKRSILPPTGRGKPDCLLIVAGKILAAHRGLISMRCGVLREKLIEEAPVDDGMDGSIFTPTQVLIPELVTETGKALHTFLYTGVLPPKCVRDTSMIKNLLHVGRKFRLPRLIVACDRLIKIHEAASQSLLTSYEDLDEDDSDDESSLLEKSRRIRVDSTKRNFIHSVFSDLNLELPPSTLGRDLGSLVGDSQYADVRFIAEGRSLSAHRFILEARCEYFRVLFNSGMSESVEFQKSADGNPDNEIPAVVDIVVPDTFVGLLRLLIFLYTDVLPDGADGALLEDLMSADRYQVHDLKRLCESMLIPTHDNWIDILRAATLFHSPQLEEDVKSFLRDNIEDVMKVKDMGISEEFPELLTEIMEIRRVSYPLPPAQSLVEYTTHVAKETKEKREQFHMPWWAIVAALASAFVYQHVIRVVSLGVLVPVVNVVIFLGIMYYFYHVMLTS